jgi:hypothetical protein
MAKKQRKLSHSYKSCPAQTRTLTGVDRELDEARKWQVRQFGKLRCRILKGRIATHGLLAVYRAAMKDAERAG